MQEKQRRQVCTMSFERSGNVQNPIKPVDIVLVVDMSGSMEGAREGAIKQGVKSFLSSIENTAYAQYVNVGLVGYQVQGILVIRVILQFRWRA